MRVPAARDQAPRLQDRIGESPPADPTGGPATLAANLTAERPSPGPTPSPPPAQTKVTHFQAFGSRSRSHLLAHPVHYPERPNGTAAARDPSRHALRDHDPLSTHLRAAAVSTSKPRSMADPGLAMWPGFPRLAPGFASDLEHETPGTGRSPAPDEVARV